MCVLVQGVHLTQVVFKPGLTVIVKYKTSWPQAIIYDDTRYLSNRVLYTQPSLLLIIFYYFKMAVYKKLTRISDMKNMTG
jgi:hypothetical protein